MDVPGAADEPKQPDQPRLDPEDTERLTFVLGRGRARAAREPLDPSFGPYIAPPVGRRRRGDWRALAIATVVAILVMVGCCLAGFAVFVRNGGAFG
jgi:hypothetical protein